MSITSLGTNSVTSVLRSSSSEIMNDISEQIEQGAWDMAMVILRIFR